MIQALTHHHHAGCAHAHPPRARREPAAECPDSVALGVVDLRGTSRVAFNVQEAALWALNAAVQAASQGSTGVGGVLLGPHRELLAMSCNRVFADGKLVDPTAHGERQIVDWYFEKRKDDPTLPAPSECTIVTSLDPCLMCTGSILASGFNVISNSLDSAGGVNFAGNATFTDLPEEVREAARQHFSYFEVKGHSPYQGPAVFGERPAITPEVSQGSLQAFLDSLKTTRPGTDPPPTPLADLRDSGDPAALAVLKKHSPEALTVRSQPDAPGPELAEPLLKAARQASAQGGAFNAAALVDPHGNLLVVRGGREGDSPVRTPFMELTRAWATIRAQAPAGSLPSFKDCLVVTLQGPAPDGQSVMEFGAYGSSVRGHARQEAAPWQYVLPRQSQARLEETLHALPPFYSELIHPRIEQVRDPRLVELCHLGG